MVTEQAYKLDTFLSSVEDRSIFDFFEVKVKNDYPKLARIVKKCRIKLEEASQQPRYDELTTPQSKDDVINLLSNYWNEQSYNHEVMMPIGGDYYNIIWSIPKAKKVIETYKLPEISFYVDAIAEDIAPGSVNPLHLKKARQNTEPITVIQFPLLNSQNKIIIIDGNHRLAAKIADKEEVIQGFLLKPEEQYKALAGELDRVIYTVHNNLGLIIEYMAGRISKGKLKQCQLPF